MYRPPTMRCFGVADGGALHGALHGARAAARAHVHAAQAEFVAHLLGVLVLLGVDRVAAPADHEIRLRLVVEDPRIAQDVEYRVGDRRRVVQVEAAAFDDLVADEDHVAQDGEHVFLHAADHLAIDECLAGRVLDLELDAPGLAHQLHLEILVAVEDFLGVVGFAAGVEHGQRALAEQRIKATRTGIEQLLDLGLGEVLEAAARSNAGIHEVGNDDAGFQVRSCGLSSPCLWREVYSTGGSGPWGRAINEPYGCSWITSLRLFLDHEPTARYQSARCRRSSSRLPPCRRW